MFSTTTNNVKVTVTPIFLPDQSIAEKNLYVWAYHVAITNCSEDTIQLLRRHWRIIDDRGVLNEVKGEGVIGKQPILKENEGFQYSSGTYLPTPSGIMEGTFEMKNIYNKANFEVRIPTFSLDSPYIQNLPS